MSRISTASRISILVVCGARAAVCAAGPGLPSMGPTAAPAEFYTLMAEIARTRDEPRIAALSYAAAARADPSLWPRAATLAAESLQPS
ncbi:MAG: hypothetical protein KGI55_11765, partial [Gammaproteobacteria bacterium]|nr:hypothetical protein [Gammaproteobacteria bacterium]